MTFDHVELIFNRDIYTKVIEQAVLQARRTVWIATADLKDLHIKMSRGYSPILERFEEMAKKGVRFRIIHAKIPTGPFRDTMDRLPTLCSGGLELQICPRSHWKMIIVDNTVGYFGSANFTGAGLGVKNEKRRNLEVGAITGQTKIVKALSEQFDAFWIGEYCRECRFKADCPDPIQ